MQFLTTIDSKKIISISLSSQAETLVILNKEGKPIRNAISWLDTRSIDECKTIASIFDNNEAYKFTGQPEIIPTWPITKILWLKNNENDNFKKAFKFSHISDRGAQTVHYYGHYSNATRGRLKKEDSQPAYYIIEDDAPVGLNRSWARPIQKIYEVDPLTCPRCGKIMKIIGL